MCGYFITRRFSSTMASTAAMASGVTTGCAWPGRGESVTELMPFMNFQVHPYTCCSDRHASPYWTFIRRWISMGFTASLLKKLMTERCSSLVHVASGAASFTLLLHRRVAFLHHTATCRPLFKPSVSLLSTWNFSRTFKIFIWIFHVSWKMVEFMRYTNLRKYLAETQGRLGRVSVLCSAGFRNWLHEV